MGGENPPPPESVGQDSYFHGMSSLSLPPLADLEGMDAEAQHKYLKRVAKQCEKVITLIDDSLTKFERKEGALSIEEQITTDMARLKKLPLAKQYREMTLWRRVRQFNEGRLADAKRVGYGAGVVEVGNDNGLLLHQKGDKDEKFVSYRDVYLKNVVDRYQNDLNKIREKEGLDEEQTTFLISCLEASADIYANLQCIEEKEDEG